MRPWARSIFVVKQLDKTMDIAWFVVVEGPSTTSPFEVRTLNQETSISLQGAVARWTRKARARSQMLKPRNTASTDVARTDCALFFDHISLAMNQWANNEKEKTV